MKVSDNCAEAQTSSVVVYTVPQFVDSNILSNRIGCSPFATEFIHPKLNVRIDDYNYSLKWKWDINNMFYVRFETALKITDEDELTPEHHKGKAYIG